MKAYCRTHHRIKHSGYWRERRNLDGSIDYISLTGHRYHSPATGYLDLLGVDPDDITDPGSGPRRRRDPRGYKAARIRAERRRQQSGVDLARIRRVRIRTGERSPDDDKACPY